MALYDADGPPLIKLICGSALMYAAVRTVWAIKRRRGDAQAEAGDDLGDVLQVLDQGTCGHLVASTA
jgi:hypothetical protein